MKIGLFVQLHENFEEDIRHAKRLGFDFGQLLIWDMNFYTDENLKRLKDLLTELDFTVTDIWCGWSGPRMWKHPEKYSTVGLVPKEYRRERLADLKRGAEFAYKLGVKNIITHMGYIPDDPDAEARIGVVEALKELCGELLERGQSFSFETGQELPLTLSMVINEVGLPNLGVNFDPANLITGGRGNPCDAMDLLASKVSALHAKDGVPPKFGETGGRQVPIGEGRVDFEGLLVRLRDAGYKGDIVIEHEMAGRADRDADILASKAYLEGLIKKVGI